MRVLFWSEGFWPPIGGVEVLASRLLPALAARGHEILVVTDDDGQLPARVELRSIPIRRLGMRAALRSRSPARIASIRSTVEALQRELSPQLIHLNGLGPTAFFLHGPAKFPPRPMLVTLHSEWPLSLSSRPTLISQVLADATWVTAVCEAVLAMACECVPQIRPRSSIIHNAVAAPDEPRHPLPFDPPRVLCVGRLAPEKGIDRAIEAFARVTARHPAARLIICGDGAERAALEAQAARLGVADKVELTGWISPGRIPEMMNTGTLLLMPSRQEALPLAGIEAALMARPTVATRAGGLPELIEHGVTGLLVDDDADALANAVAALLADPERTIRMGQAARERARQRFAWQPCVDSYHRMYEKLAQEGDDGGSRSTLAAE